MPLEQRLAFEIHCADLPGAVFQGREGLRLGLQEGKRVVQDVSADVESALFRFELRVREGETPDTFLFYGQCAQGTPQERFFYLCWGFWNAVGWEGALRAKIPLMSIDPKRVRDAIQTGEPLRARIKMTDAKGKPVCASLKAGQVVWEA